ncbi:MAG: bifunctional helix-turn-helix transcriptional regulator/GNAT family N-acetyltransferase [Pseudacidovorax sp.]|uniref:bifunctional helix-turn-helix transcriptional regulator/GNAT family N-acetyltransferase n=1 Tax=Pseudacidovorax sp. TaxID=1934311 RepID=UPI001B773B35|nr:bifunctional helix-turn-helix transcriptional regulator/GNAT family N-acetyltransferase [Pseudacidovorax sp.]MBP6893041.1 bifunctional helix-turn-helix transcriptional regulator/GNAT family N-acetyltransferase [Pseudacidovorax sp.]
MPELPASASSPAASAVPVDAVKALRRFNRFFTQRIGVLEPYLGSELSLTEVRVLYELAHQPGLTARELAQALSLDAGYLSRLLKRFESLGWLARATDARDARQQRLSLTEAGHVAFSPLQQRSRDAAAALLAPLAPAARDELVQALARVETLFEAKPAPLRTAVLRDPAPGDLGWVVQQHGEVYAREYGWDGRFEAAVADIAAQWLRTHDPAWEKGWIAELDGQRVGAVFVIRHSPGVAQLRLLVLKPEARGLGLGGKLVDECIAFARARGYKQMILWTHSCLEAARALYAARGFALDTSEPHEGYGSGPLVAERWSMTLTA